MTGGMMKAKTLIATDINGKQYVFSGVNSAVPVLGIAPTTIRRHAADGTPIDTLIGRVTLKLVKQD